MAWFTKDSSTLKPPSYTKGNEKKHISIEFLFPNVYQNFAKSCPKLCQNFAKTLPKLCQKLAKSWVKHGLKLEKSMAWFTKDTTTLKPPSYTK